MARPLRLDSIRSPRDMVPVGLLAVCAAGFYAAPWLPVYGVFFVLLAVLSFKRMPLALALVPAFAPFVMEPKVVGHLTFAPTEPLVALDVALAAWMVVSGELPLSAWKRIVSSPFFLPAGMFLIAVTMSTVAASDRHLALHAYRERVLDPMAYFALLLVFVRRRTDWHWIVAGLLAGGTAAGAIGLGQFALQRGLSTVNGTGIKRVQALYGSPDNLGLLFDRVVPSWFVLVLTVTWRRRSRVVVGVLGLLLVIPLLLTFSVGAWIAVSLVCGALLSALMPWGKWVVLALLVGGAAGAAVKHRSVERAFQAGHANSTQTRLDVWRSAVNMIRDHPLLGIGPDNFQRMYAPTARQDKYNHSCLPGRGYMQPGAGSEPCLSHPHNELLDFWLSAGILGLISYVWLLTVFVREGVRLWRGTLDSESRPLLLIFSVATAAGMIHGLIDNSYFLVDLSLLFWLTCAGISWLHAESSSVETDASVLVGDDRRRPGLQPSIRHVSR